MAILVNGIEVAGLGKGVPQGGAVNQYLIKRSADNYDTKWAELQNSNIENGAGELSIQMIKSNNQASGKNSTAFGSNNTASGENSHAEGYKTIANQAYQHVQGRYNIIDEDNQYVHIVGNGDDDNRSNAHTLDWGGNAWFAGNVYVGNGEGGSKELATTEDLANYQLKVPGMPTEFKYHDLANNPDLPAGVEGAILITYDTSSQ